MNRKLGFWLYFALTIGLFLLVLLSFPGISQKEYSGLLFGYQEKPFYLMMFSVFDLFFDYVSLTIPQAELRSIRSFFLIRRPTAARLYATYFRFILPYFIPFILTKMMGLLIFPRPSTWLWIGLAIVAWPMWLLVNLNRKFAISNSVILAIFVTLRVLAHFYY